MDLYSPLTGTLTRGPTSMGDSRRFLRVRFSSELLPIDKGQTVTYNGGTVVRRQYAISGLSFYQ